MKSSEGFHFTQGVPPESFSENLQLTNRLDEEQYSQLLEVAFDFLQKPESADEFHKSVQVYASTNKMKLPPVQEMVKTVLIIAKEASRNKLTPGQLFGDLQKLKQKPERASKLCQMWRKGSEEKMAVEVSEVSKRLVNMEWKFGVTSSNSEMHRVGNCFIEIKMILSKGLSTESLSFEMTLHQFYDFMHEMEKTKLELGLTAASV